MLFSFALIVCLLMLAVFFELASGIRRIEHLSRKEMWSGVSEPPVSVIVPACNEEQSIEKALRLLCRQRYDNLEIIVVNDRSTDRTAGIVEKIHHDYKNLRVITVEKLPVGWLGKPHALQVGARVAKGDYLVFTDADVSMEETTISRAVSAMHTKTLDHLSLIFQNSVAGWLLNALITDAGAGLALLFKPWRANNPGSRFFFGVGAFNMVRSSSYWAIGGHEQMRMQPIDDVFLGKMIKRHGFQQDCLFGQDHILVPWYGSVGEMISGLMKNVYALFHYRIELVILAVVALSLVVIVPTWCIFFTSGLTRSLFILAVVIRIAAIGAAMIASGLPAGSILCLLFTPYISIYIILRSAWITKCAGGISWRGSFYPLAGLRESEWLLSEMFRFPWLKKSKGMTML